MLVRRRGKPGPAVAIVGREVGSAVKRLAVGKQENSHRPAAAAGHDLHGVHVDLVEIGTLFAIHFDADEVVVHQLRDGLVFERLVLHHVTPVTGGVSDAEQDRFVFLLSTQQGFLGPGMPVHGIVCVLKQIRAGFVDEAIWHGLSPVFAAARLRLPVLWQSP